MDAFDFQPQKMQREDFRNKIKTQQQTNKKEANNPHTVHQGHSYGGPYSAFKNCQIKLHKTEKIQLH